MPGPLLHLGAVVTCMHAGQATPTTPYPRVLVNGQPVVTQASPYVVAGCTLPPPTAANGPCVTAQYVSAAIRVKGAGVPVLLWTAKRLLRPPVRR